MGCCCSQKSFYKFGSIRLHQFQPPNFKNMYCFQISLEKQVYKINPQYQQDQSMESQFCSSSHKIHLLKNEEQIITSRINIGKELKQMIKRVDSQKYKHLQIIAPNSKPIEQKQLFKNIIDCLLQLEGDIQHIRHIYLDWNGIRDKAQLTKLRVRDLTS